MSDLRDQWAAAVLGCREIPHACARTAWALREYANREGRTIVNNATLARDTGQCRRFVRRHIALLLARGFLVRFDRGGNGFGRSNSAITQLMVPGLFEHQAELELGVERGVTMTPPLYKKTGVKLAEKGGHQVPKGGSPRPPRTNVTNEPGADARARLTGSRAAPRKKDPRACVLSLLNAPGLPYPDEAIARNCGVTLEELAELRREHDLERARA